MINLHERMLPTSAGVEPATSWSPVGRRIQLSHRGIESFKILFKMSPKYLHDLLSFKNTNYSFSYKNLVDVPRVSTSRYSKATFHYEATQLWNSLPNHIRATGGFGEFVMLIRTWEGASCKVPYAGLIYNSFIFCFYLAFSNYL